MAKAGERMQEMVLAILRREGQPRSAYELLSVLQANRPNLAPPSVYRALAALTDKGVVHRIESMKAYVASQNAQAVDDCILAICDDCGVVEERLAPTLVDLISTEAGKSGFAATRHVLEVHGFCAECAPRQVQS